MARRHEEYLHSRDSWGPAEDLASALLEQWTRSRQLAIVRSGPGTRRPTRKGVVHVTGTTVLYVNDRGADEVPDSLESSGFRVLEADDPVDAIKRLDDEPIDCLVLSRSPDERTVERFVRFLRREDTPVPLVILGERGKGVDAAVRDGPIQYVEPGEAGLLEDRIRDAMAERRIARGLDRHRRLKDRTLALATRLPGAGDRRQLERAVYDELSTADLYRFVWLCEYDSGGDGGRIRFPFVGAFGEGPTLGGETGAGPEIVEWAVATGNVQATDHEPESSNPATDDGVRNPNELVTLAVPFVHEDAVHGVLVLGTDHPGGGDGAERALLADLGAVVGRELDRRSGRESATAGEKDRLERFAQELAHELRNPLGVASAHLELARDGEEGSIDRARTAIDEIDRIVDGMLSLAAESGHTEDLDLEDVVTEIWEAVDPTDAELVVEGSRTIEADRNLLDRLLANLFQNAVEHGSTSSQTSPGGAVEDSSTSDPETEGRTEAHSDEEAPNEPDVTVRVGALDTGFYVEDDGPGVPNGERDRIFEWGYSGAESGAGIGLAVVSTIATNHGWTIDLTESRSGGARFEVTDV